MHSIIQLHIRHHSDSCTEADDLHVQSTALTDYLVEGKWCLASELLQDCAQSLSQHPSHADLNLCRLLRKCMQGSSKHGQAQYLRCISFLHTELVQQRPLADVFAALLGKQDSRGITPLMAAIEYMADKIVLELLRIGADAAQLTTVSSLAEHAMSPTAMPPIIGLALTLCDEHLGVQSKMMCSLLQEGGHACNLRALHCVCLSTWFWKVVTEN